MRTLGRGQRNADWSPGVEQPQSFSGEAHMKARAAKPPVKLPKQDRFTMFAQAAARLAGKPATFVAACALIVCWALSGPFFGFDDTWQLMINTTTTIITFLMVFLIQNTQTRDQLALQIKLSELIIQMRGAPDVLADAEELSEKQLDALHEHYKSIAREKSTKRKQRS
jgi:low affinity Fe/Cu permease